MAKMLNPSERRLAPKLIASIARLCPTIASLTSRSAVVSKPSASSDTSTRRRSDGARVSRPVESVVMPAKTPRCFHSSQN
jgi:hypothetical protein